MYPSSNQNSILKGGDLIGCNYFHVRGYTVDPEKAALTTRRITELTTLFKEHGIDFRELDAWPQGLTTITVDQAVRRAVSQIKSELDKNPKTLIGLSGHSLGAIVALIAASRVDVDFLILEDAPIGGIPDLALELGGLSLNEAVITGLRKNCVSIKKIKNLLADEGLPPILEIRSGFAIRLNLLLFGAFPLTGRGEVARFYRKIIRYGAIRMLLRESHNSRENGKQNILRELTLEGFVF